MRDSFAYRLWAATAPEGSDVWPRTARPLPWLLAGFLVLLFMAPISGITLDIPSPVDPKLDRYALAAILAIWLLVVMLGTGSVNVRKPMLFLAAAGLFVALALLSIVMNVGDITRLDLLSLTQNRLALLLAFVSFAVFSVTAMRPAELGNFTVLLVGLASLCALGVIVERRTGFSIFYDFIGGLFDPIATVIEAPTEINPDPEVEARKTIVGPTEHGLAVTTMLSLVVPFAVVRFMDTKGDRRWLYAAAIGLMIGAALSTERKTGVLAPLAAMLVIAAYRPRAALRMLPLFVVLLVCIKIASPGALGTVMSLGDASGSASTVGRSDDYSAIAPEFLESPLLGSGYGSRDILDSHHVRILDNEYLAILLTAGLFGLLAFFAMIISPMVVAHRVIRSGDPTRAGPALAASSACAVFLIASALFDILSFAQAPYVFFFVAAIATVAGTRELREAAPVKQTRPAAGPRPAQLGTS